MERADKKAQEKLTKLKADRELMEITAPADGVVYYGSIKKTGWNPVLATKALKVGGILPSKTTVMTFVKKGTPLELTAKVEASDLRVLVGKNKVIANTALNPHIPIVCSFRAISSFPQVDGKFLAEFDLSEKGKQVAVPGIKAKVKVFAEEQKDTLVISKDYLTQQANGGYTVKLKMADGETKEQAVKVLSSHGGEVVITDGLEEGQVILK